MYPCWKECMCYHEQMMSNPIMRRFHVQGCVVAQPRLGYHGHRRPKHVVLRSRSKPILVDRTDRLLYEPSFVTTVRITAAPNRLESNCRHEIALNVSILSRRFDSQEVLILGIFHDADIKEEVVSGRLTQKRIDWQ